MRSQLDAQLENMILRANPEHGKGVLGPLIIVAILLLLLGLKGWFNELTNQYVIVFWAIDVFVYVLAPVFGVVVLARKYNIQPDNFGLFVKQPKYIYSRAMQIQDIILGAFLVVVVYELSYLFGYVLNFGDTPGQPYTRGMFVDNKLIYWFAKLYMSTTAAITEEIVYRGMIFLILSKLIFRKHLLIIVYLLLSSSLFVAGHIGQSIADLIAIFMFSIAACCIYLKLKRIEPLIVGHFSIDIIHLAL